MLLILINMKNIDKNTFDNDLNIITDMFEKYSEAIYESQEGQVAHYDNQLKLIRLCMEDVRCGLNIVRSALIVLDNIKENLIED